MRVQFRLDLAEESVSITGRDGVELGLRHGRQFLELALEVEAVEVGAKMRAMVRGSVEGNAAGAAC